MTDHVDASADAHRGHKRKAEELVSNMPKRIKPLDPNVVNKIAAGEIIVAPVHALKEMMENAVDAGATSIEITVKDGGMKLLQISDNGHGIHVDDLTILCERFTTSKLQSFDDLSSIATYGFRGEALASISHIAHLKITTKTAESSCAYQAHFRDGKLVPAKPGGDAKPKPTAGRTGTQITVEDLFYNVPQRRKAFRSASEEYAKILEMVGKYAIHCQQVAFSCRKQNDNSLGLAVPASASIVERIGSIYNQNLAKELIYFKVHNPELAFTASGYASGANHHAKKTTILLFINHRAVESSAVRTAIQRLYNVFLPKGSFPFVYLSLEIAPERVDVNVHPTKREVGFLNEEAIIDTVCQSLREALAKVDASRTYLTQSILPVVAKHTPQTEEATSHVSPSIKHASRTADSSLVRTDPKSQKITSLIGPGLAAGQASISYGVAERPRMDVRLTSVKELRLSVRTQLHQGLSDILTISTWVGVVDTFRRVAAVQAGVRLYMIDYGLIANEFFYQLGLTDFGNFGTIRFEEPLDIESLIRHAVDGEQKTKPESDLSQAPYKIVQQLVQRREMLAEYFRMEISEDGRLMTLPLLLKNYVPPLAKLPRFLMRLGPCVNWSQERECFRTFLGELAGFYAPEKVDQKAAGNMTSHGSDEQSNLAARRAEIVASVEHILFPAFKSRLVATGGLLSGVVEIADLKGLYRVFERC